MSPPARTCCASGSWLHQVSHHHRHEHAHALHTIWPVAAVIEEVQQQIADLVLMAWSHGRVDRIDSVAPDTADPR
eukprot:3494519-Prymnesium_polylepis.1